MASNRLVSGAALLLMGAAASVATSAAASAANSADGFQQCLAGLQSKAQAKGVSAASYKRYTADLAPDMSVIELLDAQPEFSTPIWDYLAALVDQQRVDDGKAMLKQHAAVLEKISRQYGVDAATVVAVWGVESDYGKTFGKRPLLTSLSTLSCYGRRQSFFQGELFATLKLLQSGDIQAEELNGSWAGAFGHTQFMPSTYQRIAVDGDGDGRRDLVASIPDALASTANYLKRSGWRTGQPWGYEVKLPSGFNSANSGRKNKRPLSSWAAAGVRKIDGSPLPSSDTAAGILLPAGAKGPAFIVMRNFDAIYSYNAAESYALAIAHLSDRLRGQGEFVTPWPTDDPGLSRAERKQVQVLLLARGYEIGEADGMIGTLTRRAIVSEQKRLGLQPQDGRAGKKILRALQAQ